MQIKKRITESITVKNKILMDENFIQKIESSADMMISVLKEGGKIHFCGNGGSAADAQHLAAELSGRFLLERPPLNAEALHCNTSYLTAVANDYGFELVFSRLLKGIAKRGDLLVGLSTSGNSSNMINAYKTAKEMGVKIISLTGMSGGEMGKWSDILLNVPSSDCPRIQEAHIMMGHILCELIENALFGEEYKV